MTAGSIISLEIILTRNISLHAHAQVVYYNCINFQQYWSIILGGVALTRNMDRRTDGLTDGREGQGDSYIPLPKKNFVFGGINMDNTLFMVKNYLLELHNDNTCRKNIPHFHGFILLGSFADKTWELF